MVKTVLCSARVICSNAHTICTIGACAHGLGPASYETSLRRPLAIPGNNDVSEGAGMTSIAWIGLGQMGRPMAAHLVHAGHTVRGVEVHDVAAQAAREAGIEIVDSIAEAVADADV